MNHDTPQYNQPTVKIIRMKYIFIITCGILMGSLGSHVVQTPPATQLAQSLYQQEKLDTKVDNVDSRVQQLERSVDEIKKDIKELKGK